ncbi:hypothetical protein COC42_06060 [Sphingomonas spermidinifaciens]|uniref:Uncharacterized protein n=1 Tax=Sphingomonas spermidinifaciens TaxID=1141889 RepID=A0A2A4B7Y3_9SPHN|nr:hypothetical protein [Sphingomonas spermidinifaciens]PCD03889.1 hypothetical protein COC42_06060 [Sphingomonas spermidinifaciens]
MDSSNPAPTDTITSTTPAGAADAMMPVTITHLILIVVAIVLTILMILWGQRRWRQRREGERELSTRGETVEVGGEAPIAEAASTDLTARDDVPSHHIEPESDARPVEPPPPPVAPAPPPIADTLPATPPQAAEPPLTTLKGLGPKAAAMLGERGVSSIAALAALTPDQAAALDADLGPFAGRMARDRWHEQAQLLAAGDRAGYEAIFGKLG